MPARRPKKKTAAQQCCYKEGGRRCQRNGFGRPPLCRSHQIAMAEVANQANGSPFGNVSSLLDDLLSGRKPKRGAVSEAINETYRFFYAELEYERPRRPGPMPPPGGPRRAAPPPRRPQIDPDELAKIKARRVLGFADRGDLTADMVKGKKRELAKKHHPDRPGGSTERMAQINAAADLLLESL